MALAATLVALAATLMALAATLVALPASGGLLFGAFSVTATQINSNQRP